MERKRRYGAPHLRGQNPGTLKAAWSCSGPMHLIAESQKSVALKSPCSPSST